MKLDKKDVISVAKARVNRAEGNRFTLLMLIAVGCIIAGSFVLKTTVLAGWGLVAIGVIVFIWYMNNLSKKQNAMKAKLLREWQQEQGQEQK